jgi:uncharacterized membrane protein YagU involved in acid resistance
VVTTRFIRMIYGAVAGSLAAACMTVIRMTARRRGVIEKTVPQAAVEWLSHRSGLGRDAHPVLHHLADQVLHLGYGAALGAGYAAATRRRPRRAIARGLGYGFAAWVGGSWLLLPLLRAKQAAWRKGMSENAVDLLAHLVFGAATAIVADELSAQSERGPSSDMKRWATRVG